jgi:predicted RNA binding protein YcfA (HicA-like mRNA interferase family)
MKSREFVRDHLLPLGAVLHKKDGDHHIYALPNGEKFVVPMGGGHSEAKPYLISKLKRLLARGEGS